MKYLIFIFGLTISPLAMAHGPHMATDWHLLAHVGISILVSIPLLVLGKFYGKRILGFIKNK